MTDMAEESTLRGAFGGRRVLVTGHTGFKGGWLALWLHRLGAKVVGVALPPRPGPSFYESVKLGSLIDDRRGDITSADEFAKAVAGVDPDFVFHLAAQAFVRQSYDTPVDTYLTNVVGTAVVLDAVRRMPSVRSIVVVTSDKCYENREWVWGYRETDHLGGADPYSSSKGCTELVASAYRRSFFANPAGAQLASVRAGNVIGGGDWGPDRLVPDIMRATLNRTPVRIRNPRSIRPWQHVLDPLFGYLLLAAKLLEDGPRFAGAWNFGPETGEIVEVETLAREIGRAWGKNGPDFTWDKQTEGPHEASILRLDSTKARTLLGWRPRLGLRDTVQLTVEWYQAFGQGKSALREISEEQIARYLNVQASTTTSKSQAG